VAKGWKAKGLLKPLWLTLPGKREELAERTEILPQTLSGYNSGKLLLGLKNGRKIAAVFKITLLELGRPIGDADEHDQTLLDRLQEVEGQLAAERERFDAFVQATTERLAILEEDLEPPVQRSTRRTAATKKGASK
jgi:transcriptional regulator with XRE-family HTH domain